MGIKVKICGITRLYDALAAAEFGAHAIGFVFYSGSRRYIHPDMARDIAERLPSFITKVGVFVDESISGIIRIKEHVGLDRIQVYEGEAKVDKGLNPSITIMGFRIKDKGDIERARISKAFPLLDTYREGIYGGSGRSFDWKLLRGFARPFILAGGINEENIVDALKLKPYAIDIASGCESEPGIKDHGKMKRILRIIRDKEDEI